MKLSWCRRSAGFASGHCTRSATSQKMTGFRQSQLPGVPRLHLLQLNIEVSEVDMPSVMPGGRGAGEITEGI